MFVNPGGPGESGVELVRDGGPELSTWGRGRFNVVGWDPRGTNASDPVRCFTSKASRDRFWRGVQIPVTPAASRAYARKAAALAPRCGRVSGPLLDNISTADTARDLNRLRQLVGDRKLTYVGLSYGTMIGQTYENMFPGRVRAMLLDGLVDPVKDTASAESRLANDVRFADGVFFRQFVGQCQRAGPSGCALAGHSESVAQRVARLFARARRAPIPAPHAKPPGVLDYSDLLLSTFTPLRLPVDWPRYAKDSQRRGERRRVGPGDGGTSDAIACRVRQVHRIIGDFVSGRSCQEAGQRLAARHRARHARGQAVGTVPGLDAVGPVRGELAGARHRALRRTVERQDQDPDPAAQQPARPGHRLRQRPGRPAAARQRRAADRERLWPPDRQRPQQLRPQMANPLSGASGHPTARHRLRRRQAPLPLGPPPGNQAPRKPIASVLPPSARPPPR